MKRSLQRSAAWNRYALQVLAVATLATLKAGALAQPGSLSQAQSSSGRSACRDALAKGGDLLAQQKPREAQQVLLEAAQACPAVPEIHNMLGLAYDFGSQYNDAQAFCFLISSCGARCRVCISSSEIAPQNPTPRL